eukprot:TRINITY_DN14795_c0_g1_i2.p1 TRINITY_DN14795_c0_g1~~TRINITY_DN14795_c0_g1_i2.p1  ORF type:complete len:179 (-),score=39.99 TRINITY_DN14795_c0_g1_i2:140-676(-)
MTGGQQAVVQMASMSLCTAAQECQQLPVCCLVDAHPPNSKELRVLLSPEALMLRRTSTFPSYLPARSTRTLLPLSATKTAGLLFNAAFLESSLIESSEELRDGDLSGIVAPPARNKYRLLLAYDGTGLSGWQYQKEAVSVQQRVEEALAVVTRQTRAEMLLVGAGRTDAGVHARGQVP